MAAGTAAGGWRIIKTLGHKLVKLHPINGFAAETSAAAVIMAASSLGIPVSTTHNISSAIMGVGTAKRFNAIKWTVVEKMIWAWILTIPAAGGIAYMFFELFRAMGFDLASIHAAGSPGAAALRADLKKRPRGWLNAAAKSAVAAVKRDYEEWRN